MKNFVKSRGVRVAAVLLCALFAALTMADAILVTALYNAGFYSMYSLGKSDVKENLLLDCVRDHAYRLCSGVVNCEKNDARDYLDNYSRKMDIYYKLTTEDGKVYSRLAPEGKEIGITLEYTDISVYSEIIAVDVEGFQFTQDKWYDFSVTIFLPSDRECKDSAWYAMEYFDIMYDARYAVVVLCVLAALLAVGMYVFAVVNAGKRIGADKRELSFFDKIPLDLVLCCDVFFALYLLVVCNSINNDTLFLLAEILCVGAFAFAATITSMTLVVRAKCGTFWRNNITVKLAIVMWRVCTKIVNAIPLFWKALLLLCVVGVIELISVVCLSGGFLLPYALLWLCIVCGVCFAAYNMSRLQQGAKRLAQGELDAKIPMDGLVLDFKEHAQLLNSIGDGMSAAVEEKMKGERFKTELITNVSHDIKTPVTSIINYVDLLDKCELEGEDAKSYIDVLKRQSEKLKKLVEDIVEASKASSGVINVDFEKCDLSMLLSQAMGEFDERFAAAGLSLVGRMPDEPVKVYADGRLVFRIFDNLLGNALKYSLGGTRVYLTLTEADGVATVTVVNVSREQLPANGNEFTERFVRGDASRHTEGSGLGLSIAKSLAEVQNASLTVETDGDFFKAIFKIKTGNVGAIDIK